MDRPSDFETPPGCVDYPPDLRRKLTEALTAKGPAYQPRTELLQPDGRARFVNRLILEDSPYLLQHAHNPVDWYSWGPEAFAAAVREDRPIFLSIGYSTCHWCHVMEVESFDNVEIARLMNQRFVCIKVDREQRPDVDEIYMTAVLMTTGHGGWPMSSFLTPQGKPFFGATYFPPARFAHLLERVGGLWKTDRARLLSDADRLSAAVAERAVAREQARAIGPQTLATAVQQSLRAHDDQWGGFSGAPKFPHEPELLMLLQLALRTAPPGALEAATHSLDKMARGGIYDQVAGGFSRYSTDDRWLVPHFEKMLYNQAHLSRAYLEAYRLTGDAFLARVARQTLDYVLRDMTSPQGAFYSATDADSEGEEGLFFLWTPAQLRSVLGQEDGDLAIDLYQVAERGNFEGQNILNLPVPLEAYARKRQMDPQELLRRVDGLRERLYQEREKRIHPLRDDKVLTSWNAMMITAFAVGSDVLGSRRYLEAARTAAEFLWTHNRKASGDLWRVHLDGSSSIPANQEDYAYLAEALLALYDSTAEPVWLDRARELTDAMLERFWDAEAGAFFMSASGVDPHLIARPKNVNDGAIPSGNSVAVRVLSRLGVRTGDPRYSTSATATLAALAGSIERYPAGHCYMLMGVDDQLNGESGPRQYAAGGAVRAEARVQPDGKLEVELRLRPGWHVNSYQPRSANLVATTLELETEGAAASSPPWTLSPLEWPDPCEVRLGFQTEPLLVYEDRVTIRARLELEPHAAEAAPILRLRLRLQACNDQACQLPETLRLQVPVARALRR